MKKAFKKTLLAVTLILLTNTGFSQQWDGLTLYSNGNATAAYLVDTNNVTIKSWTGLTGGTGYSSYLAPGGTLVRSVKVTNSVFNGGGACGGVQKIDYNGTLTWNYTHSSTTYYTHHDHCVLPNGNVLMIAYELKTQTELAAAGGTNTALTTIWPEKIIEVQPTGATTGNIVWEWHVWDHLVQNTNSSAANYQSSIVNHPELLNINYQSQKDWMHCNGLDYNPMLDQIALSSHNMNEWYIIDHSTTTAQAASHSGGNAGKGGDFLYRWGNPAAYQATGTKYLNVTHDVHWIPEFPGITYANSGRLVGFNNQGISTTQSCVDQVITPRVDYNYSITPGSAFAPSIYDQRTSGFGYTSNEGSSEQFPNGNTLVCVAISGKIYELNPAGTPIFTISTGAKSSQAHRYSTCYINNAAPTQPTITTSGNDLTTATATTYQWYYNGNLINGATSQNYTPTQNGIYVVRTTDANGCVNVYSQGYSYSLPTTINEIETKNISVYPNPSTGIVDLNFNYQKFNHVAVEVFDMYGKNVATAVNNWRLDLSELSNGIYTLAISLDNKKPSYQKIILNK
jgi:hypothetical protein